MVSEKKSAMGWSAISRPAAPTRTTPLTQLRQGLAVVMSAEALFILTDLCGLSPEEAVASTVRTARSLTAAAVRAGTS